ncbi:MAG: SusD/RagB family nutrient-binding outer membrane lipoprotein [Marinifilum sp.]|jgi:hypothetical protein|nr:SusD/RagB family nutrient-binding outer membrane lipoprotein [Marinifilum sp.]
MNTIKKLLILVLACVNMISCTDDFEEINTNPNYPENATPDLMLVNILRTSAYAHSAQAFERAGASAHHIAKWDYNDFERFQWDANNTYWQTLYSLIRDIEIMMNLKQTNDSYKAVGLTMKAWAAAQLTDNWGNVPYAEAAKGKSDENFTPIYNTQQEIYTGTDGIIESLEQANSLFKSSTAKINGDIIFEGDLSKWQKFANSLRMRYLMRISAKVDVATDLQQIISNEPIMESNADNMQMEALGAKPNQSYPSMLRFGDYNLWLMTNTMDSIMHKLNDPRMSAFFDPAFVDGDNNPVYAGFPVGITDGTEQALGVDQDKMSRLDKGRFYDQPDGFNYMMMNYAEVEFIKAEAAQKGIIAGGDALAETHYNNGINASLAYYSVDAPDYLTEAEVAYNSAKALNQIMTQKWLANFLVGFEGWFDFKRTGLPEQKPNLDNINVVDGKAMIPSRYYYPADEQLNNKENYQKAIDLMGGSDHINFPNWWENK